MSARSGPRKRAGVDHVEREQAEDHDALVQAIVESKFDAQTFVGDYPVRASPLAKPKRAPRSPAFEMFGAGASWPMLSRAHDPIDQRQRSSASPYSGGEASGSIGIRRGHMRREYGAPMGAVGSHNDPVMYLTVRQKHPDVILFRRCAEDGRMTGGDRIVGAKSSRKARVAVLTTRRPRDVDDRVGAMITILA